MLLQSHNQLHFHPYRMKTNFFHSIRTYFDDYCAHTTVHGLQYFGEKKRHVIERIWWFIVFVLSLAGCIYAIYSVYRKWADSPVIVNFGNTATPIYEIPFPAVTICPEAKSSQTAFNFTQVLQKKEDGVVLNDTEENYFEYMSLLCDYYPDLNYNDNETFSEEFYTIIEQIKPQFQIVNCFFMTMEVENCQDYFDPIITDEGICYTFNMLEKKDIFRKFVIPFSDPPERHMDGENQWNLQDGYTEDAGVLAVPVRAYLSGAKAGFTFNVETPKQNQDYACRDSFQGYRIQLHTPMTVPRPSQKFFPLPLDQRVFGAVKPIRITTSTRIKAYKAEQRKCYFSSERYLQFFKNYTSSNCNLECLTNYTLETCKCVNYFMPRENGTEICGSGKITCMKQAELYMHLEHLTANLETPEEVGGETNNCNCLPVCADLTYEVDTSQTEFEWKKLQSSRRSLPQLDNNSHLSSLTLFFTSDDFILSERNELYGPMDFLSSVGGILGLFSGFSVLSLMEIFYFLTIRIVCNLCVFGQWTGAQQ